MSKSRIGIIFILICLATTLTFAQSFLNNSSTPAKSTSAAPAAVSPDDFRGLVKQQSQQTQTQMKQQMNQSMSAEPPFKTPQSDSSASKTPTLDSALGTGSDSTSATAGTPTTVSPTTTDSSTNPDSTSSTGNTNSTTNKSGLGIQY